MVEILFCSDDRLSENRPPLNMNETVVTTIPTSRITAAVFLVLQETRLWPVSLTTPRGWTKETLNINVLGQKENSRNLQHTTRGLGQWFVGHRTTDDDVPFMASHRQNKSKTRLSSKIDVKKIKSKRYPKLRAKAAQASHLIRFALELAREYRHTAGGEDRFQMMHHLSLMYDFAAKAGLAMMT